VVDQKIEHLLEDIAKNKDKTEQGDTHGGRHAQRAQQVSVKDLQNEKKGASLKGVWEAVNTVSPAHGKQDWGGSLARADRLGKVARRWVTLFPYPFHKTHPPSFFPIHSG
jgi:hypothetical protein